MAMSTKAGIEGIVRIRNKQGEILNESKNLIMTRGRQLFLNRFSKSGANSYVDEVGVGNGDTAATLTDTGLAGSSSAWGTIAAADKVTASDGSVLTMTHTFTGNQANFIWKEAALRDNNDSLLARVVFGRPTTKSSGDSLIVEWIYRFTEVV